MSARAPNKWPLLYRSRHEDVGQHQFPIPSETTPPMFLEATTNDRLKLSLFGCWDCVPYEIHKKDPPLFRCPQVCTVSKNP
jgi:hypothetical protein